MPKVATPFKWFGGKTQHADWILRYFPRHNRYIEAFGGSGALLFAKPPVDYEVYNDVDSGLVGFFRVLRDPALFPKFLRRVQFIPYSREEFNLWRDNWHEPEDPVERAARWYFVARASFSGHFAHSFSTTCVESAGHMVSAVHKWRAAVAALPSFHDRLLRVLIEQCDWSTLLDGYDTAETLWYLDPPYVSETRKSGKYSHELTDMDHAALIRRLISARGMVILSGYANRIYSPLDTAGWRRVDRDVPLRSNNRRTSAGQRRTESLWINPACWQRQRQVTLWEGDHAAPTRITSATQCEFARDV